MLPSRSNPPFHRHPQDREDVTQSPNPSSSNSIAPAGDASDGTSQIAVHYSSVIFTESGEIEPLSEEALREIIAILVRGRQDVENGPLEQDSSANITAEVLIAESYQNFYEQVRPPSPPPELTEDAAVFSNPFLERTDLFSYPANNLLGNVANNMEGHQNEIQARQGESLDGNSRTTLPVSPSRSVEQRTPSLPLLSSSSTTAPSLPSSSDLPPRYLIATESDHEWMHGLDNTPIDDSYFRDYDISFPLLFDPLVFSLEGELEDPSVSTNTAFGPSSYHSHASQVISNPETFDVSSENKDKPSQSTDHPANLVVDTQPKNNFAEDTFWNMLGLHVDHMPWSCEIISGQPLLFSNVGQQGMPSQASTECSTSDSWNEFLNQLAPIDASSSISREGTGSAVAEALPPSTNGAEFVGPSRNEVARQQESKEEVASPHLLTPDNTQQPSLPPTRLNTQLTRNSRSYDRRPVSSGETFPGQTAPVPTFPSATSFDDFARTNLVSGAPGPSPSRDPFRSGTIPLPAPSIRKRKASDINSSLDVLDAGTFGPNSIPPRKKIALRREGEQAQSTPIPGPSSLRSDATPPFPPFTNLASPFSIPANPLDGRVVRDPMSDVPGSFPAMEHFATESMPLEQNETTYSFYDPSYGNEVTSFAMPSRNRVAVRRNSGRSRLASAFPSPGPMTSSTDQASSLPPFPVINPPARPPVDSVDGSTSRNPMIRRPRPFPHGEPFDGTMPSRSSSKGKRKATDADYPQDASQRHNESPTSISPPWKKTALQRRSEHAQFASSVSGPSSSRRHPAPLSLPYDPSRSGLPQSPFDGAMARYPTSHTSGILPIRNFFTTSMPPPAPGTRKRKARNSDFPQDAPPISYEDSSSGGPQRKKLALERESEPFSSVPFPRPSESSRPPELGADLLPVVLEIGLRNTRQQSVNRRRPRRMLVDSEGRRVSKESIVAAVKLKRQFPGSCPRQCIIPGCNMSVPGSKLTSHTLSHFPGLKYNDPGLCKCPFCLKSLKDFSGLFRHVRDIHVEAIKMKCESCTGTVTRDTRDQIERHMDSTSHDGDLLRLGWHWVNSVDNGDNVDGLAVEGEKVAEVDGGEGGDNDAQEGSSTLA